VASGDAWYTTGTAVHDIPENQNPNRFVNTGLHLIVRFGDEAFLVGEIAGI
jgi:hypothetical protein